MGESPQTGKDADVHAVLGIDDVADADVGGTDVVPATFPTGSEVHSLDTILAAYLLDMDVSIPRALSASLQVLLIEPDAGIRRALWEMLEAAGHRVIAAPTPAGTQELLARHPVDLILADAGSIASGQALRDEMRASRPGLPVLVMSGDPTLTATWSAGDLGAAGYVEKPVRGLLLLAAIRDATRRPGG